MLQSDGDIWRDRIATSDINISGPLGEPVQVRKSHTVEHVYLSDFVEPCKLDVPLDYLYNIDDFGDCIKSFRLKTNASIARFYINGVLVTTHKNLVQNLWYDFHPGYSISNKAAPGAWRYLEIEYEFPPETGIIEVSYIQLVSYGKKHKEYVHIGTYGSN